MLLSERIYGSSAVKLMQARVSTPVLVVGKDRFTRSDLAHAACFSYVAAQNLSALLATLPVTSLAQLYREISPQALAIPKLGAVSLMVLGAAFEVRNLGTIESWAERHRPTDQRKEFLSFITMKKHAADVPVRRRRSRKG